MPDDLRQRYAEALAAKFTRPVYRCDKDGENERVENPEPADRVEQTPYVMVSAGDGNRSFWTPTCTELAEVVAAVRDEELEQLRYERRLLGVARRVLDLVAAGDSSRWEQAQREAEDLAQRIVDEIGHPVTDEPALGPEWRERADQAEATVASLVEVVQALVDADDCQYDHHGGCQTHGQGSDPYCAHARAKELLAALNAPEASRDA